MEHGKLIQEGFLQAGEAWIILDADATPVAVSRGFELLTGLTVEDLQDKGHAFCWRKAEQDAGGSPERSGGAETPALGCFSLCHCVTRIRTKRGESALEFSCRPIREAAPGNDGRILGYLGRAVPVTENAKEDSDDPAADRSKAIAGWQRAEGLTRLAGGIAHNFNNALAGLIGVASLAKEAHPDDPDLQRDLDDILTQARRMANWTRYLLTYAREGPRNPQRANVNRLIANALGILRPSLDVRFTIQTVFGENLPDILVDVSQFRELCEQIILNAAEATGKTGTVLIRTDAVSMLENTPETHGKTRWVRIRFEDNGPGMPPEVLSKIFDPFYTTHFPGRGLGLAAVKGVVEAHHGTISVRSEPGKGTQFDVLLPAVSEEAEVPRAAAPGKAPVPEMPGTLGGKTLLVVDDEVLLAQMLRDFFASKGMRVLIAATGSEAEEILSQESRAPDVCIMDIVLPDCMGTDLYHRLRRTAPEMPVIVCTAYPQNGPVESLLKNGAAGFLHKPFEIEELMRLVSQVLAAGSE